MTTLSSTRRAVLLGTVLVACTDTPRPTDPAASRDPAGLGGFRASVATTTANATVTDLGGVPGYSGAVARAINESGRSVGVAGGEVAVSFDPPTVLYRDDQNYPYPRASEAQGINDAGMISGIGFKDFTEWPFVGPPFPGWLPLLPGAVRHLSGAYVINNAGEVAGSAWFDPRPVTPGHGVVWVPGPDGYTPIDLGTFNGHSIEVFGLARNLSGDSRIIVGRYAASTFNGYTPVVWQNGAWTELPAPAGCFADRNSGQANDVSDAGIIVGTTCFGAGVWENGTVRVLHPQCDALRPDVDGGSDARAIAVTSSVPSRILIVGECIGLPIVWYDDGQGGYAAELLPLLEGDTEGVAHDVNSAGQIVGYTRKSPFSSDPTPHAVLWTYTPPPLTPNQAPTAAAGGPYGGEEGASVSFDGTTSTDPEGQELTFDWDFGDGSEHSSGGSPSHVYADNGTYIVTLTVDDGNGGTDEATTAATISNVVPQVNAGTASSIQSGQTLNFSGSVFDAGVVDTPSSWTLDWGDGTTALTGSTPVPGSVLAAHTYYGTGTFTLQLTVTDKDGGVGTGSRTVTVDPRSVVIAASPDPVSLSEKRSKDIDIVIFSTSELNATQIDPATLSVGDGNDPDALPVRRKNGAYVLSMRDVNRDGLPDLGFSVAKLDPNLGLAAPSTTLVVRGAVPTGSGPIVVRGSTTIAVSP